MDYFETIEKRLDMPKAEKEQALRELRSHHSELVAELRESGMEPSQAAAEATKRMGEPGEIAGRLSAANNSASWKTALIAAVACVIPAVASLAFAMNSRLNDAHSLWKTCLIGSPLFAVTAILLAGSVRSLRSGQRPVWLPSWLGMGLIGIVYLGKLAWSSTVVSAIKASMGPVDMERLHIAYAMPYIILLSLVAGLFALVCGRRGMVWLAVLLCFAWFKWNGSWSALSPAVELLDVGLLTAVAVGAFARNAHSRPSDATLFLVMIFTGLTIGTHLSGTALLHLAGRCIVPALVVLVYARSRTSAQKMLIPAAWAPISVGSMAVFTYNGMGRASLAFEVAVVTAVIGLLAVAIPLIAARWRLRYKVALIRTE